MIQSNRLYIYIVGAGFGWRSGKCLHTHDPLSDPKFLQFRVSEGGTINCPVTCASNTPSSRPMPSSSVSPTLSLLFQPCTLPPMLFVVLLRIHPTLGLGFCRMPPGDTPHCPRVPPFVSICTIPSPGLGNNSPPPIHPALWVSTPRGEGRRWGGSLRQPVARLRP